MPRLLHSLYRLLPGRPGQDDPEKLYGAIVAQARLPAFYREWGVPDTLEGRFSLLSLHLFLVLNRLRQDAGEEAAALSQALVDRFNRDIETVMREIGVSDLRIPKTMRSLAESSQALFRDYDAALAAGDEAFAAAIKQAFPAFDTAELSSGLLTSYVRKSAGHLEKQSFAALRLGAADFAEVSK